MLSAISREDIRLVYTFKSKLGSGSYGSVRTAYKTVSPETVFSVKSIRRENIEKSREDENELISELLILLALDHPNIVKLYEIYLDHTYLHLVTELLEGGPIEPGLTEAKRFTEEQAVKMIRQSLQALNYFHKLDIVHRDLKVENILFTASKDHVKLIDFGFAQLCNTRKKGKGKAGG